MTEFHFAISYTWTFPATTSQNICCAKTWNVFHMLPSEPLQWTSFFFHYCQSCIIIVLAVETAAWFEPCGIWDFRVSQSMWCSQAVMDFKLWQWSINIKMYNEHLHYSENMYSYLLVGTLSPTPVHQYTTHLGQTWKYFLDVWFNDLWVLLRQGFSHTHNTVIHSVATLLVTPVNYNSIQ